MNIRLSRLIGVGILGPAAIMLKVYALGTSPYRGMITMCLFLIVYGIWAIIVCRRIELAIIREMYRRIRDGH